MPRKPLKEVDRYQIGPNTFRDYEKSHPSYRSQWRKVRIEVLKRDNYTCQRCGITQAQLLENPTGSTANDYLNVCHLGKKEDIRPEMLTTLCRECHKKLHKEMELEYIRNLTLDSRTKKDS